MPNNDLLADELDHMVLHLMTTMRNSALASKTYLGSYAIRVKLFQQNALNDRRATVMKC